MQAVLTTHHLHTACRLSSQHTTCTQQAGCPHNTSPAHSMQAVLTTHHLHTACRLCSQHITCTQHAGCAHNTPPAHSMQAVLTTHHLHTACRPCSQHITCTQQASTAQEDTSAASVLTYRPCRFFLSLLVLETLPPSPLTGDSTTVLLSSLDSNL